MLEVHVCVRNQGQHVVGQKAIGFPWKTISVPQLTTVTVTAAFNFRTKAFFRWESCFLALWANCEKRENVQ